MILIADSGSTKCDWALISRDGTLTEFNTMGFNPFFHSEDVIINTLNGTAEVGKYKNEVEFVFYYGAGSSTKELKLVLQRALSTVFTKAKHIYSDHDMVAAALATYTGDPCIACILGTGSNSCYYDGDVIKEEVPALGHILGDEGSGAYFGKKLIAAYLYNQLPSSLHEKFKEKYGLDKATVFQNVYMKPHANVYLASFMRFLSDNSDHPFVHEIISSGFFTFLRTHVTCYSNYKEVEVHFVGSVAYYFKDILKKICLNLGIKMGKVIQRPIEGLIVYHIEHTLPKLK